MYEQIIEFLQKFPRTAACVPGGGIYYTNEKGELCFMPSISSDDDKEIVIDPVDLHKLNFIWDELNHPDTCNAVDDAVQQVQQQFVVTDDVKVVSGEGKGEAMIGRIFCGDEKASGTTLVLLAGYGGGTMSVLTAVSDAEGVVNPEFVKDLQAYAFAVMEMADRLSRRYFNEPVIPDFDNAETDNHSHFPKQRRAEA